MRPRHRTPVPVPSVSWFHIHWDRDWVAKGGFALYECRCGARRTMRLNRNYWGPVPPGWPPLLDRHHMPVADSGWWRTMRPLSGGSAS